MRQLSKARIWAVLAVIWGILLLTTSGAFAHTSSDTNLTAHVGNPNAHPNVADHGGQHIAGDDSIDVGDFPCDSSVAAGVGLVCDGDSTTSWAATAGGDIAAVGTCTTASCGIEGGNDIFPVIYEATSDSFETAIAVTDPTADRTLTSPDATGTFALESLSTNRCPYYDTNGILQDGCYWDATNNEIGIGIDPEVPIHALRDDATANAVQEMIRLEKTTSDAGHGAAGLGVGITGYVDNDANTKHEIGGGEIVAVSTADGADDGKVSVKAYKDGANTTVADFLGDTKQVQVASADLGNSDVSPSVYVGRNGNATPRAGYFVAEDKGGTATYLWPKDDNTWCHSTTAPDSTDSNCTAVSGTNFTFDTEEEDGSPSVTDPTKIKFPNGTVTDNGDGTVSVNTVDPQLLSFQCGSINSHTTQYIAIDGPGSISSTDLPLCGLGSSAPTGTGRGWYVPYAMTVIGFSINFNSHSCGSGSASVTNTLMVNNATDSTFQCTTTKHQTAGSVTAGCGDGTGTVALSAGDYVGVESAAGGGCYSATSGRVTVQLVVKY